MLKLHAITKDYPAGSETVHALKGIDLCFRRSEFVSILGPSGCGKTTMLNIIGGLDHYTGGDLIINGRSTKEYKDRDWDTYRNHSIGFVFQNYHLIPHQSVLQNVELALSLSGVKKSERRRRAIEALQAVGLGDQLRKRPAEMSGGQMQRVAIARAIVNDPDIILADEPTGALDTETSLQVMEILKKIAANRLVIMVTHNPELAEKYSTRIVRMLDGVIMNDSCPVTAEEEQAMEQALQAASDGKKKETKPSMSLMTSFGLSLKNLFTKKGRTLLTSFAGSIGIIGISLIYAVSNGATAYINSVQEETLSAYPLVLEATQMDASSLLTAFADTAGSAAEHDREAVYRTTMMKDMMNAFTSVEETKNDLAAFRTYLEERIADENDTTGLRAGVTGIHYSYGLDLPVYTRNVDGAIIRSDSREILTEIMGSFYGMDASAMAGLSSSPVMSMMSANSSASSRYSLWNEMLPGRNGELVSPLIKGQYDLLAGHWPESSADVMLVLNRRNEIGDVTLYALGLIPRSEMDTLMAESMLADDAESSTAADGTFRWSYEELCGLEFRTILPFEAYVKDDTTGLYTDLRTSETGLAMLYGQGMALRICGIIRPSEDALNSMLSSGIAYTARLTEEIIARSRQADVVLAQQASPDRDVVTGLPFRSAADKLTREVKAAGFRSAVKTMTEKELAAMYARLMSQPDEAAMADMAQKALAALSRQEIEAMITAQAGGMGSPEQIAQYLSRLSDAELISMVAGGYAEKLSADYAASVQQKLASRTETEMARNMLTIADNATDSDCAAWYDSLLSFSPASYDKNIAAFGCLDAENPTAISLYAATFEDKDGIEEAISAYNESVDEMRKLHYTDYVKLMMSSVTTIINAISYVLIAFVAISLVVSSIMIGVITLISVQERTHEIGILRAIGASKRNVSGMFNAETLIIGFAAGLVGVSITWLLCIPINAILLSLTGIAGLKAVLPLNVAAVLVLISMLLTLFAGIIPSRSAAKKDPVVALRSE